MSVKALAEKVLRGNQQGNREETRSFLTHLRGKPETEPRTLPFGLNLTDLIRVFGDDPDWEKQRQDPKWLEFWSRYFYRRRLLDAGMIPPTYTARKACERCGPVWLEPWDPETVKGCPWCMVEDSKKPAFPC